MDERAIRINEMERMEAYCQAHGIGNDNPENPFRVQIARRKKEIEDQFRPAAAAAVSSSPFIASTPNPPVTPAVPGQSFVAGK